MKRPRPVKKLIRPIQHLRPIESPKLEKQQLPQNREVSNNIKHNNYKIKNCNCLFFLL